MKPWQDATGMHNFDVLLPIDTQSAKFYTGSARVFFERNQ